MQLKEANTFLSREESRAVNYKVEREREINTLKHPPKGILRLISRWRINQKISYGYALAIGIAILGTVAGLVTGEYYEKQAKEHLTYANEQHNLLNQLRNTSLEARLHQQRLVPVLGNSVWLRYEVLEFDRNIANSKTLLTRIKYFADSNPNGLAANRNELIALLNDYENTTQSYSQLVKYILKEINVSDLKPEEIEGAQQVLLRTISGEVSIKFDRLADRLSRLIDTARSQENQGAGILKRASALRFWITMASMCLSGALAAVLAFYTSRAIARPLQAVTKVAQQVAQESNFNLQAPVTSEDEIGILATSLNQLIKQIATYTDELNQAQAQLIQTEKMSSLGQMVAGVAHEINNPINFIYGNIEHANDYTEELLKLVQLYRQQYPNSTSTIQNQIDTIDLDFMTEDLPKLLSSMKMGADRIREIVLSLRNFSRLDEAEMKSVNIHAGIDSTLVILNHRLKNDIEVIKHYGNLPLVECYPAQLNQVFMNILSNAVDALLSTERPTNKQIAIRTEKVNANLILVKIWDNGSGISREIKNKLFDPFFTTKPVGQGTGLGLYICYQIVEKHKGRIEIKSEPGQGTEFAISLPIKADYSKMYS
ncbi:sensor histidine kinase [Argonema galeatum]|uniref:sensor histidine kinase n=1 Tax=Argonema galeatum TaxID=2942762 RepID=UPI002011B119|nr:HAMP domain-containing protein [Argonema galeatum A003/A1]